jgi:A/G-specific adenine glycosylase
MAYTKSNISSFIAIVTAFYRENARSMPWRSHITPYRIVVSEIMLQQTQVHRVTAKFDAWMKHFPDWQTLAKASTKDVLQEWSGLGYNRRALFLKRIAETITNNGETSGALPKTIDELQKLPGIGPNTAGSIMAFAYNTPHSFIETNIRSVYIHHFFSQIEKAEGKKSCKKINDAEIMPIIQETLNRATSKGYFKGSAREWYWALMDYGSYLKKQIPNPSRQSAHHVKQSTFEGSNRQLRSKILKLIMKQPMTGEMITKQLKGHSKKQIEKNVEALIKEGFITATKSLLYISH